MADFIDIDIETDPDELATVSYEYLQTIYAGWEPNSANFETALIQGIAQLASETRDVSATVPKAIFRNFGAEVVRLPPDEATAAAVDSTWTMIDTLGYTIPEGTQVGIPAAGDELIAFEVAADVVVPPGNSATAAGEVQLIAVEPGADGTGLSGTPELLDALEYVASIALVGSTAGGQDAEGDDEYLDRLATYLQLLAARPILPEDFSFFAMEIDGVDRAVTIDGLDPITPATNVERTVAVFCHDENGAAVSAGVKTAVETDLESRREVNFQVFVADPTFNTIDVTFTATAEQGFDIATVEAAAEAAVTDYLDPVNWGQPRYTDSRAWVNEDTVRYLELAEVINRVDGIKHIDSLTFRKPPAAYGTSDVVMTGYAPLPTAGTINGTVTA